MPRWARRTWLSSGAGDTSLLYLLKKHGLQGGPAESSLEIVHRADASMAAAALS